jgi:hypothetical protein
LEKNDEVWLQALNYLKEEQNEDGGFGYIKGEYKSYGSMTAAGLIGLRLCGAKLTDKAVKDTLRWISNHYTWDENPHGPQKRLFYYIRALAKALHLCGLKTITDKDGKTHDWYQEVVRKLVQEQEEDGFWVMDSECLFTTYMLDVLQLKMLDENISEYLKEEWIP